MSDRYTSGGLIKARFHSGYEEGGEKDGSNHERGVAAKWALPGASKEGNSRAEAHSEEEKEGGGTCEVVRGHL